MKAVAVKCEVRGAILGALRDMYIMIDPKNEVKCAMRLKHVAFRRRKYKKCGIMLKVFRISFL